MVEADTADLPLSTDVLLDGRLSVRQPAKGHRAGTDAILLAAAAPVVPGATIVDCGAGVGTVGLILALRDAQARVVLVERDPFLARLGEQNAVANQVGGQVTSICADLMSPAHRLAEQGLGAAMADVVVTNPPFLKAGSARHSPVANRRAAHEMPLSDHAGQGTGLERWVKVARRLLKPRGTLVMIHRADALPDILASLQKGFGALCIRPVYPKANAAAIRVIITATAQSKTPASLLPGLVLHGDDGTFTRIAEAIHRGQTLVP